MGHNEGKNANPGSNLALEVVAIPLKGRISLSLGLEVMATFHKLWSSS